ncbi:hypothetical protein ACPDHL_09505 [Myroides sp. C15-4]|uniref:hypothetical protein n=1 Tax=Myroides sp. C15-4 TaxID=3400532 RepID=UPI003D2F8FAF
MNEENMRALYSKAINFINIWIKQPENIKKIGDEIEPKYLKDINDLRFKNTKITLIWLNRDYENYKVCITIYFFGDSGILLGEFLYFEDMKGNYIEDRIYFFEIFD